MGIFYKVANPRLLANLAACQRDLKAERRVFPSETEDGINEHRDEMTRRSYASVTKRDPP
jgi:hypothetical protein